MLVVFAAKVMPPAYSLTAVVTEETEGFDSDSVTPGVGGFVVVALLAVALFFLGLDLVRRLRRSKYRAEIQAELALEIAERDAAAAASAAGGEDAAASPEAPPADAGGEGAGRAHPRPPHH